MGTYPKEVFQIKQSSGNGGKVSQEVYDKLIRLGFRLRITDTYTNGKRSKKLKDKAVLIEINWTQISELLTGFEEKIIVIEIEDWGPTHEVLGRAHYILEIYDDYRE